ncbi:MAG TPA: cytochrome P450 [Polyangiaceae bacterium]|nr:cytochrome P450 [Polyangiaceae bacterium]
MATPPTATDADESGSSEVLHLTRRPELSGFGSMLQYSRRPLARFEAARRLSDRAVAFSVLGRKYVALFDLKAIEQVLVTQHAAFEKDRFTNDLERVLGDGLLTSEGETWRRHRKLMAPSFQRGEVAAYGSVMAERARAFVERQAQGVVFDVHSAMMNLTLDILVRALFGTEVKGAPDVEHLLEAVMRDYLPPAVAWRLLLPEWLPLPSRRRLARARRQLDAILLELIDERRRAGASGPSNDLLGRLMLACDADGSLSEAALRDEAMTLFLAGHETTALSLTYGLRLLAQHPAERQKLVAELDQALGGRLPSMRDLPNLPYTRAVLDETLRLFPPAWGLGREPRADVVVAGVAIPKGTQVILCPWVMHRDAQFFPEPERFWPERWLTQPAPPRHAYMPFGAGPRVCIGSHFALAEAMLILAVILQHVEIELLPDPPLELMPSVTLRPRGPVPMRVTARAPSARAAAE